MFGAEKVEASWSNPATHEIFTFGKTFFGLEKKKYTELMNLSHTNNTDWTVLTLQKEFNNTELTVLTLPKEFFGLRYISLVKGLSVSH